MSERKMTRLFTATFIACLFLATPPSTTAQTLTLKGTVYRGDGTDRGLESARIEFSPGGYVAVSDRNGRFLIPNFRPGTYDLTVRQGGNYEIFRQTITDNLTLRVSW